MTRLLAAVIVIVGGLILGAGPAAAHKPSDSYLVLTTDGARVEGRWHLALRDLELAVGLDGNRDGAVTWGEVRTEAGAVADHALASLALTGDGALCPLAGHGGPAIADHSDGAYLVVGFTATCAAAPRRLGVAYDFLFAVDAQHRGLVRVDHDGETHALVMRADDRRQDLELAATGTVALLVTFVGEGVWHIWAGLDHILFLLALLLPTVLRRTGGRWHTAPSLRPVLADVLTVVTAFTLAHSITLVAATVGLVALPSRLVETAIALSVVAAAVNNLVPLIDARWGVAFGLGLLHGFGFSSVLVDLGLPRQSLATALLGFNVGVELGQAAIVAAFLPVAFVLRATRIYRVVLLVGSLAIAGLALWWSLERAFA